MFVPPLLSSSVPRFAGPCLHIPHLRLQRPLANYIAPHLVYTYAGRLTPLTRLAGFPSNDSGLSARTAIFEKPRIYVLHLQVFDYLKHCSGSSWSLEIFFRPEYSEPRHPFLR